jgi:hypothetical protein
MIWVSSGLDFHFASNQNGYFVIRDHITVIYDIGTIRMHFSNLHSNITEFVRSKTDHNTLYDWSII